MERLYDAHLRRAPLALGGRGAQQEAGHRGSRLPEHVPAPPGGRAPLRAPAAGVGHAYHARVPMAPVAPVGGALGLEGRADVDVEQLYDAHLPRGQVGGIEEVERWVRERQEQRAGTAAAAQPEHSEHSGARVTALAPSDGGAAAAAAREVARLRQQLAELPPTAFLARRVAQEELARAMGVAVEPLERSAAAAVVASGAAPADEPFLGRLQQQLAELPTTALLARQVAMDHAASGVTEQARTPALKARELAKERGVWTLERETTFEEQLPRRAELVIGDVTHAGEPEPGDRAAETQPAAARKDFTTAAPHSQPRQPAEAEQVGGRDGGLGAPAGASQPPLAEQAPAAAPQRLPTKQAPVHASHPQPVLHDSAPLRAPPADAHADAGFARWFESRERLARGAFNDGKFAQAEFYLRQMVSVCIEDVHRGHALLPALLYRMAEVQMRQRKPEAAEMPLRRALKLLEDKYGADGQGEMNVLRYRIISALAQAASMNAPKAAETGVLHARAVALAEKVFGTAHDGTACALLQQGLAATRGGDFAAAEGALQRAHALRARKLGERHERTGEVLCALAALYRHVGRYERAARYDRRWRACAPAGGRMAPAAGARRAAERRRERSWDPQAAALRLTAPNAPHLLPPPAATPASVTPAMLARQPSLHAVPALQLGLVSSKDRTGLHDDETPSDAAAG